MSRLRFGPKFGVVIAALVAGLFVVAFVGFTAMRAESQQAETMYSKHAVDLQDLGQTIYDMSTARGAGLLQVIGSQQGSPADATKKFHALAPKVTTDLESFVKRADDQRTAKQTLVYWQQFVAMWNAHKIAIGLTPAAAAARDADAERLLTVSNKARDGVVKLMEDTKVQAAAASKQATSTYHSKLTLTLIVLFLTVASAVLLGVLLIRDVVPRVKEMATRMMGLADGDLSTRIVPRGKDELTEAANAYNEIIEKRGKFNLRVQEGVHMIAASTNEIVSTSAAQAASASQQAAAINETSSAVEEVRAASEQAAEKANEVAERARVALEMGEQGTEAVEEIIQGMNEIRETVEAIAGDIQALSNQTEQISAITSAVNDIADQSNLLALNATIEAARAGEQGKGFAVVADEVRNLAEQSKQATAQVQTILEDIDKATRAAVNGAHRGTEVVAEGSERAQRAGEIISELGETTRMSVQAAEQIAASAVQQHTGMDQIAQAVKETTQGTTEIAAGAQQSQEAAEHLSRVSNELDELTTGTSTAASNGASDEVRIAGSGSSTREHLAAALDAHAQWIMRLKRAIDTGACDADPGTVRRDDQCAFGKWLHNDATPKQRKSPHYETAKDLHAHFHEAAAEVLKLALAGDSAKAREQLSAGEFAQFSGQLSRELQVWSSEG